LRSSSVHGLQVLLERIETLGPQRLYGASHCSTVRSGSARTL